MYVFFCNALHCNAKQHHSRKTSFLFRPLWPDIRLSYAVMSGAWISHNANLVNCKEKRYFLVWFVVTLVKGVMERLQLLWCRWKCKSYVFGVFFMYLRQRIESSFFLLNTMLPFWLVDDWGKKRLQLNVSVVTWNVWQFLTFSFSVKHKLLTFDPKNNVSESTNVNWMLETRKK